MRKLLLVCTALVLGLAVFSFPSAAHAETQAILCQAGPDVVSIGETITVYCFEFTPNVWVFAYMIEPDGTAFAYDSFKADKDGKVTITIGTDFGSTKQKIGAWQIVIEELGPGHTVLRRGLMGYQILGGKEGVSGASLAADPAVVTKPEDPFFHRNIDVSSGGSYIRGRQTFINYVYATLLGSGFAPGEIVTFWIEGPNGGCSNYTEHLAARYILNAPGQAVKGVIEQNDSVDLRGTQWLGDAKAAADGNVNVSLGFAILDCEGPYHVVARGNTSKRGADTLVTLVGRAIIENAALSVSPDVITAMFGRVSFRGSGFAPIEHISCWITSPQGQTWPFPAILDFEGVISTPGFYQNLRLNQIAADSAGSFATSFETGSLYIKFQGSASSGGRSIGDLEQKFPIQSEGALGIWAFTCRGDTSGRNAIARFRVAGNTLDP